MVFNKGEKSEIVNYLLNNTDYSKLYLLCKSDEVLFNLYNRVRHCMNKYPMDILELQQQASRYGKVQMYSLQDLGCFNYNKLAKIKKSLKDVIKAAIKKNVVSTEQYGEDEYYDTLHDIEYLTPEELYIIYGFEYYDMSPEDLAKDGYCVIDASNVTTLQKIENELREKIIGLLLIINNKVYNYDTLALLDIRQLVDVYNKERELNINLPSFDSMELSLRFKIAE